MITAFITIIIASQLLLIGYFIKKRFPDTVPPESHNNKSPQIDKLIFINFAAKKLALTGYAGFIFAGIQLLAPKTALPLFFL